MVPSSARAAAAAAYVRLLETPHRKVCCTLLALPKSPAAQRLQHPTGRRRRCDARLLSTSSFLGTHTRARHSSSSGKERASDKDGAEKKESDRNDDLLYSRSSSGLVFPRSLLAMTTLHTAYWTWYVLDFTPSINAAARASAELSAVDAAAQTLSGVNPTVGYVGLGLAIMMSLGSAAYPRHLVSEIRMATAAAAGDGDVGGPSLRIRTLDLPFVTPERGSGTDYPLGSVTIDSKKEAEDILVRHGGDIGKFRGHLALRAAGLRGHLLLKVQQDDVLKNEDVLLNALLPVGMGGVPVKTMETEVVNLSGPGRSKSRRKDDARRTRREQRLLQRRRQQNSR